jgi:hypothetical protein
MIKYGRPNVAGRALFQDQQGHWIESQKLQYLCPGLSGLIVLMASGGWFCCGGSSWLIPPFGAALAAARILVTQGRPQQLSAYEVRCQITFLAGLCKGTWAVTLELHTGASTDAAPSDFVRGRPFSKKGFEIKWIRKLKTSNDKPNSINSTDTSARTRTVEYLFATLCKGYINRLNWSLLLFLLYMPIQCLL